jgi:hypothetical protein
VLLLDHHPQAIRRSSFTSVKDLVAAIGAFTGHWNDRRPRPFAWTKDADEITGKIRCAKTKANVLTEHSGYERPDEWLPRHWSATALHVSVSSRNSR